MPQTDRSANIHSVAFYGEDDSWSTAALLHSEPLVERSSAHAWRISPHRHDGLVQLFWLSAGGGQAQFDTESFVLDAPCIAVIPENCVHEFDWQKNSGGYVLSLAAALVRELRSEPLLGDRLFRQAAVLAVHDDFEFVNTLFRQTQIEFSRDTRLQEAALDGLIRLLAVWVARRVPSKADREDIPARGRNHFSRFIQLLDQHHKSQWNVAKYAANVGVSPSHLNALAHEHGGASAKRLIQDRLLLAARRQLTYTDKPIAAIAQSLGFSDASYFTRFFKRGMELTPKAFRRRSGTEPAQTRSGEPRQ